MAEKPYRTLDARPSADSLIKPGELVDLIEVTPLSLNDRRIYNQLLENAWDAIDKPVSHVISKAALRGKHNSNDRVGESLERLMSAVVKVSVNWDGGPAIERVQLLGGNIEALRSDGLIEYEIPARLRKIIGNSTVFARLQREVMFALSSKYALTLYVMVQKRGNLRWRSSERFSLEALRGILGVPKGKLTSWSNLKLRALDPAVAEVNDLSDFMVAVEPIKSGRSVTHVELKWWRKDEDATGAAGRALQFSKVFTCSARWLASPYCRLIPASGAGSCRRYDAGAPTMLASWPKAQCVGATGSFAFGRTRCSRSALSREASTRISAVSTTRDRLRSDRLLTEAQRSSSDRYRSSSGRLNHSDDTRPFRSPWETSTFQPPARSGRRGFRTSIVCMTITP